MKSATLQLFASSPFTLLTSRLLTPSPLICTKPASRAISTSYPPLISSPSFDARCSPSQANFRAIPISRSSGKFRLIFESSVRHQLASRACVAHELERAPHRDIFGERDWIMSSRGVCAAAVRAARVVRSGGKAVLVAGVDCTKGNPCNSRYQLLPQKRHKSTKEGGAWWNKRLFGGEEKRCGAEIALSCVFQIGTRVVAEK